MSASEPAATVEPSGLPLPRTACEGFLKRSFPRVRSYLIARGAIPQDAEEIALDSCKIIFDRWEALQADPCYTGAFPSAYLFKVAVNLWHRRGPRETARLKNLTPLTELDSLRLLSSTGFDDRVIEAQTAQRLIRIVLGQLSPEHREILWLRYAEEFSTAETAKILQLREGTVKSRLAAARERFVKQAYDTGALNGTGAWEAIARRERP